jgi:hypothetical protein
MSAEDVEPPGYGAAWWKASLKLKEFPRKMRV